MTGPVTDIFESATVRRAAPPLSSVVRLTWHAPRQGERLVQVYVNRQLRAVSDRPAGRAMWLHLDAAPRPALVELVAVAPADRWTDHAETLAARNGDLRPRAALALRRDEALPVDSRVRLFVDGAVAHQSPLWGRADSRGGFGAAFGIGGFGHDAAAAPGFGRGELGVGPFGRDGDAWRWSSDDPPVGDHTVDAEIVDPQGRTLATLSAPLDATIAMPPPAPPQLAFEAGPTGLRLRWSD